MVEHGLLVEEADGRVVSSLSQQFPSPLSGVAAVSPPSADADELLDHFDGRGRLKPTLR